MGTPPTLYLELSDLIIRNVTNLSLGLTVSYRDTTSRSMIGGDGVKGVDNLLPFLSLMEHPDRTLLGI